MMVSQEGSGTPERSGASKVVLEIVVAVVIALAVGGTSPWWWDKVGGDNNGEDSDSAVLTQEPSSNLGGADGSDPEAPSSDDGAAPATDGEEVTPPGDTECVITVENPLVSINEEPTHTSREVGSVPVGSYTVSDEAEATFAGRDELWFEITADGRTGWVLDNTILIGSKSSACP